MSAYLRGSVPGAHGSEAADLLVYGGVDLRQGGRVRRRQCVCGRHARRRGRRAGVNSGAVKVGLEARAAPA
jgi:hypothetical protein